MKRSSVWISGVVTVAVATIIARVASRPSIWNSSRPANCLPDGCFCEAVQDQLVRQPANALSGLAFVAVGIVILLSRTSQAPDSEVRPANPISAQPVYAILLGIATLIVGAGTTLYHASLTFWSQTLDVFGMYLVVTFVAVYSLGRIMKLPSGAAAAIYGLGNAALLGGLVVAPEWRRQVFAALVGVAIGLEVAARRAQPSHPGFNWFLAAVLVLVAGGVIWAADIMHVVCSPHGWLQGHAVWHLAGAAALWFMFRYYRSATFH